MDRVMNFLRHVWSAEDLRNRILITITLLVVYRLAAHIPVPGINADASGAWRRKRLGKEVIQAASHPG
mgnify:CR=1 FL=1